MSGGCRRRRGTSWGTRTLPRWRSKSGQPRRTTWRTVYRCDVYREGREIRVDIEGSGFLYNMVRNIVGTLIEVGRGYWEAGKDPGDPRQRGPGQCGADLAAQRAVHAVGEVHAGAVPAAREGAGDGVCG